MNSAHLLDRPLVDGPETGAARCERQLRLLRELAEIGIELARVAGRRAMLEAEEQASALRPAGASGRPGEAARTFCRLSNAVRAIIAMELRLAAGGLPGPASIARPATRAPSRSECREDDGRGDRLSGAEAGFLAAVGQIRVMLEPETADTPAGEPARDVVAEIGMAKLRAISASTVDQFDPQMHGRRGAAAEKGPFWRTSQQKTGPPP